MINPVQFDRVGDLISTIGAGDFGSEYFRLFQDSFGIEQCTVFAFRGDASPLPLIIEVQSAEMRDLARSLASDYVGGGFERDPNIRAAPVAGRANVYSLRADDVTDRGYRRQFYDTAGLAHELVLLGNAGSMRYYSSFYRTEGQSGFGPDEVSHMQEIAGIAIQSLHRHSELQRSSEPAPTVDMAMQMDGSADKRREALLYLRDVLLHEPHKLSPREAEVCAGIVLGYSTLAISLNFGISVNTVATHRKRAYAKLRISSQNELFARYFATVARFQSLLPS